MRCRNDASGVFRLRRESNPVCTDRRSRRIAWGTIALDPTTIREYADLVDVIRRRQDELLRISCLTIDEIAGLHSGHYSKITAGLKGFGSLSLFNVLQALGLRLRIEPDPDATAKYQHRWEPRQERSLRAGDQHWRRQRVQPS